MDDKTKVVLGLAITSATRKTLEDVLWELFSHSDEVATLIADLLLIDTNNPSVNKQLTKEAKNEAPKTQRFIQCENENCGKEFDILFNKEWDCITHPGMMIA
jgi:hypothetical protein